MKKIFLTTLVAFLATIEIFAAAKPKNDYIDRFKHVALEEKRLYNIPACVNMAQAILESNWGEGKLALSNNHFGVKCHAEWLGEYTNLKDDDYDSEGNLIESCFRAYETPEESWRDHSIFLQKPRYQPLYDYGTDYRAWSHGLKAKGYATDSLYAEKLISIIERYDLYKLDGLTEAIPAPAPTEILSEEVSIPKAVIIKKTTAPMKPKLDGDEDTLPEITPANEQRFDDETIENQEKKKPNAFVIPKNYIRGQGMKKLEDIFNNLKKTEQKIIKNLKKEPESDELDFITPEKESLQQKGNNSDQTYHQSRMISEKVVAYK